MAKRRRREKRVGRVTLVAHFPIDGQHQGLRVRGEGQFKSRARTPSRIHALIVYSETLVRGMGETDDTR